MSTFPIKVEKITLNHRGGTKSYHLAYIINGDNDAVLIKRWGKTSAFGQMDVSCGRFSKLIDEFNKIRREKEKRGYEVESSKDFTCSNLDELKKALTIPMWTKLGADAVKHLVPDADTTGVKEPEKVEFEKDANGNFRVKEKKPLEYVPEPDPPQSVEEKIARNPNWGLF